MTKQEEIREGIAKIICCLNPQECNTCAKGKGCPDEWDDIKEQVNELLTYLHSQGIVIKVEGKLPKTDKKGFMGDVVNETMRKLKEAGYTAWESLIKEQ